MKAFEAERQRHKASMKEASKKGAHRRRREHLSKAKSAYGVKPAKHHRGGHQQVHGGSSTYKGTALGAVDTNSTIGGFPPLLHAPSGGPIIAPPPIVMPAQTHPYASMAAAAPAAYSYGTPQ